MDQLLYRENSEDEQGLGAFFRYGWADGRYNAITNFYSFGFQYTGLFEGRDEDVFGAGFANGYFSEDDPVSYHQDCESVLEAYYNIAVSDNIKVGPSLQYICNPSDGAGTQAGDALVLGLRAGVTF